VLRGKTQCVILTGKTLKKYFTFSERKREWQDSKPRFPQPWTKKKSLDEKPSSAKINSSLRGGEGTRRSRKVEIAGDHRTHLKEKRNCGKKVSTKPRREGGEGWEKMGRDAVTLGESFQRIKGGQILLLQEKNQAGRKKREVLIGRNPPSQTTAYFKQTREPSSRGEGRERTFRQALISSDESDTKKTIGKKGKVRLEKETVDHLRRGKHKHVRRGPNPRLSSHSFIEGRKPSLKESGVQWKK